MTICKIYLRLSPTFGHGLCPFLGGDCVVVDSKPAVASTVCVWVCVLSSLRNVV